MALGQGGGGGGSSGGATGSTGGAGQGATGGGSAGAGQSPVSPGPTGPGRRAQTEQQLRDAGVAPSPEQEERQLRDLNAITRQLTPPAVPVPAPEVERR